MSLILAKYSLPKLVLDFVVGTIRFAARKPQTHSVYIRIDVSEKAEKDNAD